MHQRLFRHVQKAEHRSADKPGAEAGASTSRERAAAVGQSWRKSLSWCKRRTRLEPFSPWFSEPQEHMQVFSALFFAHASLAAVRARQAGRNLFFFKSGMASFQAKTAAEKAT